MRRRRRLKNGLLFTLILLGSAAAITLSAVLLLEILPRAWGWPTQFWGGSTGRRGWQSAFGTIALVVGLLGGIRVTTWIDRGREPGEGVPLFFWLLGMAFPAELVGYGVRTIWPQAGPSLLHGSVLGSWLLLSYLRFLLTRGWPKPHARPRSII